MSIAFRNEIDVTVSVVRGAIAAVEILPRSRPPLTRLFAGKQVSSLLSVLPRLFSLCAIAHQVAFLSAFEAANGVEMSAATRQHRIASVMAERLAELLRGLFVGHMGLDNKSAAAVRAMMQAIPVLGGGVAEDSRSQRDAVSRVKTALAALGISGADAAPASGSPLALHIASLEVDALTAMPMDETFLSVADDRDVVARLFADGAGFSESPELDGRIPETGVWARSANRKQSPQRQSGPAVRLQARVAEIARLCAWLEAGVSMEEGVVESYAPGSKRGAAAVECARGRLYHALELDGDGQIVRFEFLAPTEWNFHARGPLVRRLQGAMLAGSRRGREAVRALVGSFDPCVGFSLNFREAADA
jgi:Nickel-dependent hydrogenase